MKIDIDSELTFKNSFLFPLQNKDSRREVIIGGLLLLIPFIGWILNMGHRIAFVHNMQQGRNPWPAWVNYKSIFKHGFITFLGMVYYYIPGGCFLYLGYFQGMPVALYMGAILLGLATIAIPGFMSHYCKEFDSREIFNPFLALNRCFEGGWNYWKAWAIVITGLILSFLGFLFFGIGFLFSSVWFWQAAGFSFACVFSKRFKLSQKKK